MNFRTTLLTSIVLVSSATFANAASLQSLVAGGTLTQGDVTFSGFAFVDFFDTAGFAPFAGDRAVSADEIDVTTTATAETVSLTATLDPAINISGAASVLDDHLFEFFLDFSVSVSSTSSRKITGVTLDNGDLFATGDGVSEVIYDILDFGGANDLEIFEAPGFNLKQESDFESLTATKFLNFEGQIEGNTAAGATAGLSTFSITFDLEGSAPPPPPVVPLPAGLPLLIGALSMLALARRWGKAA